MLLVAADATINSPRKCQFKLADKLGARNVAILGPDEIAQGVVTLRNMGNHEEQTISFADLVSKLA